MKVSNERKTKLYETICDPLMRLRVNIHSGHLSKEQIDEALFTLQALLYHDVKKVLNIK